MSNWINRKGYYQGVLFSLMFLSLGPALDAGMKFLGTRLHPLEVIFFRFFFSLISIAFYMTCTGNFQTKTSNIKLNVTRGLLGYISFVGCIYSVTLLPLAEVTTIFWTMPFFVLILSALILKEKVNKNRWFATILGFSGLYFFICPSGISFQFVVLIPILSAFCFALQDVIIKHMVDNDPKITMMFYFALIATLLGLVPVFIVWKTPNINELVCLSILGIGGNLMQYFIFKAFSAADLSALAPFRYTEFIVAAIFGYAVFGEIPSLNTYFGAALIVPTTLYLMYSEILKNKPAV